MTESYSRQRQQAEDALGKTQAHPTARDRAFEEIDASKAAAEEKTSRLRQARLSKEAKSKGKAARDPARSKP